MVKQVMIFSGTLRTCGIEVEPAMHVFEVPADVSDHHVARTEFRGGVPRFEEPLCQGSSTLLSGQLSSANRASQDSRSRATLTSGCNFATDCWSSR